MIPLPARSRFILRYRLWNASPRTIERTVAAFGDYDQTRLTDYGRGGS